jgi:uncharacterized phiE125 gp8 family phage protein
MPLLRLTGPTIEPVDLSDLATFARREDTTEDDALLETLLVAAREHVEAQTGRCLISQTWVWTARDWPCDGIIKLPRSPLLEVLRVQYRDSSGTFNTLTINTDYVVDITTDLGTVEPITSWPALGCFPDAIEIVFRAGYLDTDGSPAMTGEVPSRAKVAIMNLATYWYDERTPANVGNITKLPLHVERMLAGLRVWQEPS